jgi:hypothetical protein
MNFALVIPIKYMYVLLYLAKLIKYNSKKQIRYGEWARDTIEKDRSIQMQQID